MSLSEDIQDLNKRIAVLTKQQDEVKKTLAVEEHKLSEIEAALKEEGYDVKKMNEKEITDLLDKLTQDIEAEQKRLGLILDEAEKRFAQFQELR